MVGNPPSSRDHPDEDVRQGVLGILAQSSESVQETLETGDSGESGETGDATWAPRYRSRTVARVIPVLQARAWMWLLNIK